MELVRRGEGVDERRGVGLHVEDGTVAVGERVAAFASRSRYVAEMNADA